MRARSDNGGIFSIACFEPIRTNTFKKEKGEEDIRRANCVKIKSFGNNGLVNIIKMIYRARIAYRFVLTANNIAHAFALGLHGDYSGRERMKLRSDQTYLLHCGVAHKQRHIIILCGLSNIQN